MGDFKLRSTRLLADDPAALFRFYRDGLGLTPQTGGDGGYSRLVDDTGGVVEVFPLDYPGAKAAPELQPRDRAALAFETADIHEAVRALGGQGASVVREPTDFTPLGVRIAHLRDPAGNLIVLLQKLT